MAIDNHAFHAGFSEHYADNARPVWDTGRPQQPFIDHADQIRGPILDVGCGTGTLAVYFARRGEQVTGIDFVQAAVDRARVKAREQNLAIRFRVSDFFTADEGDSQYQSIIDSGLFHIFSGDERRKRRYSEIVSRLLHHDGRLYLLCCKKQHAEDNGVTTDEIYATFSGSMRVESLSEFTAETVQDAAENIPGKQWVSYFAVVGKN